MPHADSYGRITFQNKFRSVVGRKDDAAMGQFMEKIICLLGENRI